MDKIIRGRLADLGHRLKAIGDDLTEAKLDDASKCKLYVELDKWFESSGRWLEKLAQARKRAEKA